MEKHAAPPPFARASLDVARENIGKLLAALEMTTGISPSFACKVARGDPKFAATYLETGFGMASYDALNSRLSAVWPEWAAWPADVPRQAPADVEPEVRAMFEARLARTAPQLPGGASWPEDIPAAPAAQTGG